MDPTEAAELLAAANRGEGASNAPDPAAQPAGNNQPAQASPASTDQPTEGTTPEESFAPGIDPSSLPPQMQDIYRSMQSHFTKATQALAEKSKSYDGLNADEARQALDFVNALNTDPDYAVQVHSELTRALQAQGLTLSEASAQATDTLSAEPDDGFGEGTVPPEILQRLERAEQYMQETQMSQQQYQLEQQLNTAEAQIKQAHPEWDEGDFEAVYAYAYANGGNLSAAADTYTDLQARIATRYFNQKGAVPAGTPMSTGYAQTPPEPAKSLDEATTMAREEFMRSFGE